MFPTKKGDPLNARQKNELLFFIIILFVYFWQSFFSNFRLLKQARLYKT